MEDATVMSEPTYHPGLSREDRDINIEGTKWPKYQLKV